MASSNGPEDTPSTSIRVYEIPNVLGRPASHKDVMEARALRWKPDFRAWPSGPPAPRPGNPCLVRPAAFSDTGSGLRREMESGILEYMEDGSWAPCFNLDSSAGGKTPSEENGGAMAQVEDHMHSDFSHRATADGKVFVSWHGRLVKTLRGNEASAIIRKLETADPKAAQLILAKATGNFKRGNERR